ncbi:MAG: replicative DNA helicase [Lachnospiraceae bacterium]|nr:replicative DNA helicase [Lachnospiraceae bacterium]
MDTQGVLKRTMPNSIEAEQSVIGAMIMDNEAVETASEHVTSEDFYSKPLGVMYDAILSLHTKGKNIDVVTLQDKLREMNVPPEFSSFEYIEGLIREVPTSANVKDYARIVYEKATLRRLIRASEETANIAYAQNTEIEAVLNDAEKRVFDITQKRGMSDYVPISKVVSDALDRIEAASKTKGNVTGIATGFTDLDYSTSGLQPSDLILIAARPSMGKTALALNIAQYMAFHQDETVAIFSLEMSKEQLVNRLFAMEARVDAQKLRSGNLTEPEWEALIEGANVVGASRLIIDDTPGITVPELRSKCRRFKSEHDLKIIFIDYLQLMSGSGHRGGESRQQEISEISRSLKALARELNVPVVALSQLSRAVESRPDHRPMLSDLRESGAIEQDADVVMFIYRDDYYNKDTEQRGIAEIIIAKQRNGPIGKVELLWRPDLTKFQNLARQ